MIKCANPECKIMINEKYCKEVFCSHYCKQVVEFKKLLDEIK